jgi:hypothetical protein
MNAAGRTLMLGAGLVVVMTLGACDNKDNNSCSTNPTGPGCPPPPTTVPAQTRNVIKTGSCEGLDPNVLCFFDPFTTSQRGDMDVTVDWTFPEDNIQVMVSSGTCTLDQINASQCTFITSSQASTTPKPRVLTVRAVAAGTYQLYVGNRGPKTESVSVQIGLTTPGSASSAVGASAGRRDAVHPYARGVAAR